ncbi:NB-ARC domain-containing protein [Aminobacter sp. BA135]|uniref:NB-ARC domain-containing protein n=1 Tax=Aminobacter sp. BA135 TaxID=537596 RepID=UPI003D798DA2
MIHLEIERNIAELHKSGCLDETVFKALVPGGAPHDFEGFQFDYKFFIRPEQAKDDEDHIADLVRDFVSFYNSMGGYILLLFPLATQSNVEKFVIDNDKINQLTGTYVGKPIGIKAYSGIAAVEGVDRKFILLYIPKRRGSEKPRPFVRNSRNIGAAEKQKFIIKKGDIYCRYEHECRAANDDVELLTFLFSEREPSVASLFSTKIENNLPPRDPNLIQFVGRKAYLESLWQWISEPRRPIKVLTAAGGLGKTTVAYEFATQILDRPGSGFEKIVWLSGKKVTFASLLGRMVSTTRCDFENVAQLLDNLLLQVGSPTEVIQQASDIEDKISLCIEAFSSLSVLLIVDDVDSLPRDEQNDLYSTISQIIIAANVQNDNSRVLFTSRLELLTGREQRIAMQGFEGVDFNDYISVNVAYLIADEKQAKRILDNRTKILSASAGSPIFITSIIRLVSLGHELSQAVSDWRGKNGEQIRAFAFEREIDQLTVTQREILYAMQLLSRARVDEIKEICELSSVELETDLAALKDYHLYATKGDTASGTVLEVPEPIRLMHDVTRGKIPDDRRKLIERACLSAKSSSEDPARYIALTISQTVRHWKNGDYDVAEAYLTGEIQKNSKIGEFYCLRARTRLSMTSRKPEQIESDFEQAEKYGCNPFDLLKYWFIFKLRNSDWRGLYRLHKRKSSISESFPVFNCCRVMAAIRIADRIIDRAPAEAREYYSEALKAASEYIASGKSMGYFHQLRALMNEAAIGHVKSLRKDRNFNDPDLQIFRFVASCLDFHLAPTFLVRIGLTSLEKWITDGAHGREIQRQRSTIIDDIDRVSRYLSAQNKVRFALTAECERIRANV